MSKGDEMNVGNEANIGDKANIGGERSRLARVHLTKNENDSPITSRVQLLLQGLTTEKVIRKMMGGLSFQ